MVKKFHCKPAQVRECPNGCPGPVSVTHVSFTEPEEFELWPGITSRNPPELVGWHLDDCGCFISGNDFHMIIYPDQLPYFVPVDTDAV